MANEFLLKRLSDYHSPKYTWSFWIKRHRHTSQMWGNPIDQIFCLGDSGSNNDYLMMRWNDDPGSEGEGTVGSTFRLTVANNGSTDVNLISRRKFREHGWYHMVLVLDTNQDIETNRIRWYVNGEEQQDPWDSSPARNYPTQYMYINSHAASTQAHIGQSWTNAQRGNQAYCDFFWVPGQAMQASDFGYFKNTQWKPLPPSVIKKRINDLGGFGMDGFYLPMNDGYAPGANFAYEPDTILKLQEDLAQPKASITNDILRKDLLRDYLVLACPLNDSVKDFSPSQHSGSLHGNAGFTSAPARGGIFYGNTFNSDGADDALDFGQSSDFSFSTGDFTIEGWWYTEDRSTTGHFKRLWHIGDDINDSFCLNLHTDGRLQVRTNDAVIAEGSASYSFHNASWHHVAVERHNGILYLYLDGIVQDKVTYGTTLNYGENSHGLRLCRNGNVDSSGDSSSWYGYANDFRIYKGVGKYKGNGFNVNQPFRADGMESWRGGQPDTPVNKFPILALNSEYHSNSGEISRGSLQLDGQINEDNENVADFACSSGKWYYELRTSVIGDGGDTHFAGWVFHTPSEGSNTQRAQNFKIGIANRFSTQLAIYNGTTSTDYSGTGWWEAGAVIGIAADFDNGTISVYKNGTLTQTQDVSVALDTPGFRTTNKTWMPFVTLESSNSRAPATGWVFNFGNNPHFCNDAVTAEPFTDINGRGQFKYQPPAGYLAPCSLNVNNPIEDPRDHFGIVKWIGSGGTQSVRGLKFQPDLVIGKRRTSTGGNTWVFDSVRGAQNQLAINNANQQVSGSTEFTSFNPNGFSLSGSAGSFNAEADAYVAWCWKASDTEVVNTNGTVNSNVRANTTAGFSIVELNTGSNPTSFSWGHGLNQAPELIIMKGGYDSDSYNWDVFHNDVGASDRLKTNSQAVPEDVSPAPWDDTRPDASVVYQNNSYAGNGDYSWYGQNKNCIAYCWHSVEGYSKIGHYYGNGDSFYGPMIVTGFRPRFVLIKQLDNIGDWICIDSTRPDRIGNPILPLLYWNQSATSEQNGISERDPDLYMDFFSNGFMIHGNNNDANTAGEGYVYIAIADQPFKGSNPY